MTTTTSPPQKFTSLKDAQQHVIKSLLVNDDTAPTSSITVKKCGDLVCQHDSFLKTLKTGHVVGYAAFEEKKAETKKTKKNKKKKGNNNNDASESSSHGGSISSSTKYVIALSDSVFFPEGGGQPSDKGIIKLNDDITLTVNDAQNVDNYCLLTCHTSSTKDSETPSSSSHYTIETLLTNTAIPSSSSSVEQIIDWDLRFDHMTQHSAQHLLSAVALNDYGIQTHSFSLGTNGNDVSYIDFLVESTDNDDGSGDDMTTLLTKMKHIETTANRHIRDNLPMTPHWIDPNDKNNTIRSRLIPDNLTGPLRLVQIGSPTTTSIDTNTCCGTHVPSLSHLQSISLFKITRFKSNILRVSFAAAARLQSIVSKMSDREVIMTGLLSCPADLHEERVRSLLQEKVEREGRVKMLEDKLCDCRVRDVWEELISEGDGEGAKAIVMDLGCLADMTFMTRLSVKVLEKVEQEKETVDDGGAQRRAVLLLFVGGGSDDRDDECSFFLTGDDVDLVDKVGKRVAEMMVGRGGGRNGRFQGKGTKVRSALDEVRGMLKSL